MGVMGVTVTALASRTARRVDVIVEIAADERFSPTVESAAYFVVSEALANITKHAHATRVLVRAERQNNHLALEVADDGIGGADPASGSGLRGLADRLSVLDGTVEVVSPAGGGTRLLVRIPTTAAPAFAG